jgi:spermidine/putrescine transport system substrate-binding protein
MPQPDRELDLFFEQLVEGRLSRRQVIARLGAAGLTFSSAGTLLAACGGVEGTNKKGAGKAASANHPKTKITELDFSNWPTYTYKKLPQDFEKKYGGHVKYVEEINDMPEFFGKVRQQLQRGDSLNRDLVVLTDWMAARWIRGGWVEPKDKRNIPNEKNLQDNLKSPPFDPTRSYTLPWESGMTAIGYNPKKTGRELTSINDLFDPKFKGKVTMLSDPRDTAGLVAIGMGKKMDSVTLDDILAAIDKIDQANKKGQIRRFTGNDYTVDLAKGNVWVSVAYSGDISGLLPDNPDLKFVIPEEGAILWTDNMMMPQKPPHPYAAETMMNFAYQPEVAAKIVEAYTYVTPVKGTQQVLERTNPKLARDPLIFPSDADRAKLQGYPNLGAADEAKMVAAMEKVTGA